MPFMAALKITEKTTATINYSVAAYAPAGFL
jgi:hypothetical protein